MTAPNLLEIITAAILDSQTVLVDPPPGEFFRSVEFTPPEYQARAVLDAISEAGAVEWAIQMPTFIDGDFDRTYAKDALTGKPFTEDTAKHHSWLDSRSPIPARVVSRITGPWTAVQ